MRRIIRTLGLCTLAAVIGGSAAAQDLQQNRFKVIGGWSNISLTTEVEQPFWTEVLPAASDGRITADFTSLDLLGLQGTETLRLLRMRVADFVGGPVSFVGGDFKLYDGLDLAGLILDIDTMRRAVDAYKPVMDRNMQENFNAKLLMSWPSPPQVLFCRAAISGIDDLRGKKIRSFNQTLADFVDAVGGTAVGLSFPEVVPALERGTVDCAITGTGPGYDAKWWEVTDHLYPLVLGWAPYFHAVNLDTWNSLDEPTQSFLLEQFAKMEDQMWEHVAGVAEEGINCNTGLGPCARGTAASMTLVEPSEADREVLRDLLAETVIPRWAERCGAECVSDWNATVGEALGVQAEAPQ